MRNNWAVRSCPEADEFFPPQRRLRTPTTQYSVVDSGDFRIAASTPGYLIYIGVNALPDLTAAPYAFTASLPASYSYPTAGNVLYVIARERNACGLVSNNTYPTIIGNGPMLPLQDLIAYVNDDTSLSVRFGNTDPTADKIKIWVGTTLPNIGVDTPVYFDTLANLVSFGAYAAGTYYVVAGLFRSGDGALSPTTMTTVQVPHV
jgi:hypothetical protein